MERNVSIRTPESISFYYELAGLGSRFLAVAVDTVIQAVVIVAIFVLASWATPGAQALGRAMGLRDNTLEAILLAIVVLALFLWYTGYFVIFESAWNGQTPGKRVIGIRVVRDGGYPLTFMDSVIRNLIRVIESAFVYIPSIVSAMISVQNKRLGDLAAGTIVVRDSALEPADAARWMAHDAGSDRAAAIPGLEKVGADEVALARRYVARSHMLDAQAAQDTATRIAAAIRPKLGPGAAALTDHELLVRIAAGPDET